LTVSKNGTKGIRKMHRAKIAVFAYNFPHKKTQDILLRLFLEGYPIEVVLAADPVKLNIPPASVRTKVRHEAAVHPRKICERIGVHYVVVRHNSSETFEIVRSRGVELGIVAGARILKKPIIDAFPKGIINFHPGLIPEARGLDAMLWSIIGDVPLGVTAHLIDERVDAGCILLRREISLYPDDTVFDLSERLFETQLDMLVPAIEKALAGNCKPVAVRSSANRKMPPELERAALDKLAEYLSKMSRRMEGADT